MRKLLRTLFLVIGVLAGLAVGIPLALAGALLCCTIILAPLGIPMIATSGWLLGAVIGTHIQTSPEPLAGPVKSRTRKEPGEKIDQSLYLKEGDI